MLGPVTSRKPDAMVELRTSMMAAGIYLDGAARNALWPRLSKALKANNPDTHRILKGSDIPQPEALRGMRYYPQVTSSDYGGANPPSYEAWLDQKTNTVYVLATQSSLSGDPKLTWHALPGFAMPAASPRRLGFS